MDTESGLVLKGDERVEGRVHIARQVTVDGCLFDIQATSSKDRVHLRLVLHDGEHHEIGSLDGELPADDIEQLRRAVGLLMSWMVRMLKHAEPSAKLKKLREQHPNAGRPWLSEDETELAERFRRGDTIQSLADHFGRRIGGISSRLIQLGCIPNLYSWQVLPDTTVDDVLRWQAT